LKKYLIPSELKDWNWFYLIFVLLMICPIGLAISHYTTYYGTAFSVQFFIILAGTISIILLIFARMIDIPKFNNLKYKTAKLTISITINFMLASYASFGIAFTILWGNLYAYAIDLGAPGLAYIENLKGQGIVLLLFIFFSSVSVLWTFLLPLIEHMNRIEI